MHERRAAEMRAVAGGLEAPSQMVNITIAIIIVISIMMLMRKKVYVYKCECQVIVLYLILRGLLPLPWLEPTSEAACLQDSLGRC